MGRKIKPKAIPIVEEGWFNACLGMIVMFNAVVIGLETDKEHLKETGQFYVSDASLHVINDLFLLIYILEMSMRLFSLGAMGYFSDYFNVMDFFLVLSGVIERLFFQGGADQASMLRVLRLLRLGRLARLVRLVRIFTSLWLTVIGFYRALGTVISLLPILGILCYFFALVGDMVFGRTTTWLFTDRYSPPFENFDNSKYFGSVASSMLSTFQIVTLSSWTTIARPVIEVYPHVAIFFVCFIFIATFGINNVVVGSVCVSSVQNAKENEEFARAQEEQRRETLLNAIGMFFEDADTDQSGALEHKEVLQLLHTPHYRAAWIRLGLSMEDIPSILTSFDIDNSGTITRSEFVNGVLRNLGVSRGKDVIKIQLNITALTLRVNYFAERLNRALDNMQKLDDNMNMAFEAIDGELRRKLDPQSFRNGKTAPLFRSPPKRRPPSPPKSDDETCDSGDAPVILPVEPPLSKHRVLRDHDSRRFLPPGCPELMKNFKPTVDPVTSIPRKRELALRDIAKWNSSHLPK